MNLSNIIKILHLSMIKNAEMSMILVAWSNQSQVKGNILNPPLRGCRWEFYRTENDGENILRIEKNGPKKYIRNIEKRVAEIYFRIKNNGLKV